MKIVNLNNEDIKKIINLYNNGFSLIKIGKEIGCSKGYIKKILIENGLEIHSSLKWTDKKIREFLNRGFPNYKLINIVRKNSSKIYVEVECNNKHVYSVRLESFINGHRCRKCFSTSRKTDFNIVKNYFLSKGFELIDDPNNYINSKTPLKCIHLTCGSINYISYTILQDEKTIIGCSFCRNKLVADRCRLDYQSVKELFESEDYKLVSNTYINNHEKLDVICPIGHEIQMSQNNFLQGNRCGICEELRDKTGPNNPCWNPNLTDEDRINRRSIPENENWRKQVFERDNYTCQVCGEKGCYIVAHHLDGYHWCVEKRFDINNGITLCKSCHDIKYENSFHNLYGMKNNTKEQFEEFKLLKQKQLKNSELQEAI